MNIRFTMPDLEIKLRNFTGRQMHDIAEAGLNSEKDRISHGVNANDQQAKPLGPRYAKRKLNRGAVPIRDMRLTGETMNAFVVLDAKEGSAEVGFAGERAELKAQRAQAIEPMIGLSPHDTDAVTAKAREHFAANVRDCIRIK